MNSPTLLGHVGAVAGGSLSVRQFEGLSSGIAIIGGRSYRVGQVGSFVRIPQGYHDLFGVISEVGASATPEALVDSTNRGERWMTIQLVGEAVGVSFERGISQYPAINDEVHLVTDEDLKAIYGDDSSGQVVVGRLAGAESIDVRIDLDKLITRHSAVLGSTGSGKSTTVASLLSSIAGDTENGTIFPSSRILLLDIHGEYASALEDMATVFRVNPNEGQRPLNIPYWAIGISELMQFLMGKIEGKALASILDNIVAKKRELAESGNFEGIDTNAVTSETPLPFSLKQLWFDLIDPEIRTYLDSARTEPALEDDGEGDAEELIANSYQPATSTNNAPFLNNRDVLSIRRQLDQMKSRLLDRQFDFMLHPGPWEPNLVGEVENDLPELLENWLGTEKPITILDLSGVPSTVLEHLIGGILNIVYDALVWGRETPEGGRQRPILIVMEEAHRYLGHDNDSLAREMVQRIVKEGRKFGVGAMIVSQRPSEIDETILSQCGTFVSLRLSNAADRGKVQAALSDSLSGLMDSLPILRTGEAIITGEAALLPIRCRITLPPENRRPSSGDPSVSEAWSSKRADDNYARPVAAWRAQNHQFTNASEE
jgi:DNA helicase HerA-like ATPase